MKKSMTILLTALVAAFFASCTPNGPANIGDGISCPEDVVIALTGGSTTVTIKADANWKASPSETWITVSPTKGYKGDNEVKVTVQAGKAAEGYVLFRCQTGGEAKMKVYRGEKPEDPEDPNTPTAQTLKCPECIWQYCLSPGEYFFYISSETDWEIEEDIDWLSFITTNGSAGKDIQIRMVFEEGHHAEGIVTIRNKKDRVTMRVYRGFIPDNGDEKVKPTPIASKIEGCLPHPFRISRTEQVYFSKGNLQYYGGLWQFAHLQYESNIAGNWETPLAHTKWMDQYGWATSGWDSGANQYLPTSNGTESTDYAPGGNTAADLTGQYAKADWGVYNAISNGGNKAGLWRVLTVDEWNYVAHKRPFKDDLSAVAIVENVSGVILLPDNWDWNKWDGKLVCNTGRFENNVFNDSQWSELEKDGAVFLPATLSSRVPGGSNATTGEYWTSIHSSENNAYVAEMSKHGVSVIYTPRYRPCNVRLVRADYDK